jgi:hypothetical protein
MAHALRGVLLLLLLLAIYLVYRMVTGVYEQALEGRKNIPQYTATPGHNGATGHRRVR